ncbi:NAD-dependent epimerase/dehydratase [Methylocella silvestris BL2]|uniref:GDP-L-fucose synthase n=1 Tax=Methylocella silvestris (strain DSM 15510 / CIP 108128 / LMG 27833 / NCIMB 13906 / BL2) TaxID=395965 RepID=B8EL69_METSB|nr:NAD-dependent epimerase/dehydratase family protein [Methylocella silvestris]ACK49064.1 NAD-dependent epimerase/dehydratase [Methylocella silvestris BL2]
MADASTGATRNRRIWVAGHRGMVGSAIVRRLAGDPVEILTTSRAELDLRDQAAVRAWVAKEQPDVIILAAAKVGGILANDTYPADFLVDNIVIEANVIEAAHRAGVERLVFLGSSCIYPKFAPQPIKEESLLTGPLEPTNEWYAIAKIAGIKMCQAYRRQHGRNYISVMPSNLYGLNDNFDLANSHVLPALIRKFHEAKQAGRSEVVVWGTGTPLREFLYVDDLADAVVFLMDHYDGDEPINCGAGCDVTIRELAEIVGRVVGFSGELVFDTSKPDGTPRKLMDSGRLAALGWQAKTGLEEGITEVYRWFLHEKAGELATA